MLFRILFSILILTYIKNSIGLTISEDICNKVNALRLRYGVTSQLTHSPAMQFTAEVHNENLIINQFNPFLGSACNPHSWFANATIGLEACCYPPPKPTSVSCVGSKSAFLTKSWEHPYNGISIENFHASQASGFGSSISSGLTPEFAVNSWENSPGHLAAMLFGNIKVCGASIMEYKDIRSNDYTVVTGYASLWMGYNEDLNTRIPDNPLPIIVVPPTQSPTPSPTIPPTLQPTRPPTNPPTISPTNPPTTPPTSQPTIPPTIPPTQSPTIPPTISPTQPPTSQPTNPPTLHPTIPPTVPPTISPTQPPTTPPTLLPTLPPVQPPTQQQQPFPISPPIKRCYTIGELMFVSILFFMIGSLLSIVVVIIIIYKIYSHRKEMLKENKDYKLFDNPKSDDSFTEFLKDIVQDNKKLTNDNKKLSNDIEMSVIHDDNIKDLQTRTKELISENTPKTSTKRNRKSHKSY